jgi:hypothetical protein
MIDNPTALLWLLNKPTCCDVCFSERLDFILDGIESGHCYVRYNGDAADGLFLTETGDRAQRSYQILPDATA